MLPKGLTQDIKARMTTIRGQMDGLIRMLDNEEKIDFIRKQFPSFKLDEIVKKFKEITRIGEKVKQHKEKKFK